MAERKRPGRKPKTGVDMSFKLSKPAYAALRRLNDKYWQMGNMTGAVERALLEADARFAKPKAEER